MKNLLPQPNQADESQQGESYNGTALQDVRHDVLRAEHVDGEAEDGGDTAGEESPVDPAGGKGNNTQPGNSNQGVVKPELNRPAHGPHQPRENEAKGDPLGHI